MGLCPSEPALKPEPLKVRGSSVIIHLWPPTVPSPGPCATAHSVDASLGGDGLTS